MKQAILVTVGLLCLGFLLPGMLRGLILDPAQNMPVLAEDDTIAEAFSDLRLYPNPSAISFTLSQDAPVDEVRLYNSLGKLVRSYVARPGAEYPIHDLPDGMYMVSLVNGEAGISKTLRLNKAGLRP